MLGLDFYDRDGEILGHKDGRYLSEVRLFNQCRANSNGTAMFADGKADL